MKVYTVDAFTDVPFKGNPAGVVLLSEFLDDVLMQSIATELGYSNTAFFVQGSGFSDSKIRWFTPNSEAPLCGHATVATAHVLKSEGILKEGEEIRIMSASGIISVKSENGGWYRLDFPAYTVSEVEIPKQLTEVIAPQEPIFVGFGENCYIVEFADKFVLQELAPKLEKLKKIPCRALIATCSGDGEYDFYSRYFAPSVGIFEDPVCASAHCRLIPYWSAKLGKEDMLAATLSRRGGVLRCKNLVNRVFISGKAVTVIIAELL